MNNVLAIVVGFNESVKLKYCLSSLSFCEEIIYIDLGSVDNSIEVASLYSARIISSKRELIVEKILSKYISYSKNELVLLLDPDEYIPPYLATQIDSGVRSYDLNKFRGLVLPQAFYFRGKRLKGTIWSKFSCKSGYSTREKYLLIK